LLQDEPRLNHSQVRCAFHPHLVLRDWNEALERGQVRLVETRLGEATPQLDNPNILPLVRQRYHFLEVVTVDMAYQPGDRLIYLVPQSPAEGETEPIEPGAMVQGLLGLG